MTLRRIDDPRHWRDRFEEALAQQAEHRLAEAVQPRKEPPSRERG